MPVTTKGIKEIIHEKTLEEWQLTWDSLRSCRISRLFYPRVRESKDIVRLSVRKLQTLTQTVTGHGLFKKHLMLWNDIDEYQCSLCGEADEDSWHLWEWCPTLMTERNAIKNQINTGLSQELGILKLMTSEKMKGLWAMNESLLQK